MGTEERGARDALAQGIRMIAEPVTDARVKVIMLALRRALLLVVSAIEKAYDLDPGERIVIVFEK